MNRVFKLTLLAVALVTMSSCGVRGALYLPDSQPPSHKAKTHSELQKTDSTKASDNDAFTQE